VVRSFPLSDTHVVDGLAALGRERGWIGPLLRVGDHGGRMTWYERDGTEIIIALEGLQQARKHPERLRIDPWRRAKRLLDER